MKFILVNIVMAKLTNQNKTKQKTQSKTVAAAAATCTKQKNICLHVTPKEFMNTLSCDRSYDKLYHTTIKGKFSCHIS